MWVLALGTFAVGTDAFIIAGLLPSVAGSLHVSVSTAGLMVTVFALAYAIGSPLVLTGTAAWPRRTSGAARWPSCSAAPRSVSSSVFRSD